MTKTLLKDKMRFLDRIVLKILFGIKKNYISGFKLNIFLKFFFFYFWSISKRNKAIDVTIILLYFTGPCVGVFLLFEKKLLRTSLQKKK